jgi:hypothetical protein
MRSKQSVRKIPPRVKPCPGASLKFFCRAASRPERIANCPVKPKVEVPVSSSLQTKTFLGQPATGRDASGHGSNLQSLKFACCQRAPKNPALALLRLHHRPAVDADHLSSHRAGGIGGGHRSHRAEFIGLHDAFLDVLTLGEVFRVLRTNSHHRAELVLIYELSDRSVVSLASSVSVSNSKSRRDSVL